MSDALKIIGAVALPNVCGVVSDIITRKNIDGWYKKLNFPSYRPPNLIFAPVWTSLYCSMGYASYLVWRDGGGFDGDAKLPLITYGTQLALNWAWTPIFFGQHNIKGALIEIVALTAASPACGVLFCRVNKAAGGIYVPYVAWLSFATVLNHAMHKLNPTSKTETGAGADKKENVWCHVGMLLPLT